VAHQDEGVTAAELAGVGVQFALAIVLFLFVGQWLDRRLGTAPVLLILGVFAGAGGGFYSMYRKLTAAQRQEGSAARKGDGSGRQDGQGRQG
jgi:F0F1-type ATP synthase assembly protein I